MLKELIHPFLLLIFRNPWMLKVFGRSPNLSVVLWTHSLQISAQNLRQSKIESKTMNTDYLGFKQPNAAQVRPSARNNGHPTSSTKQSYASVANGDVAPKGARNNREQDKNDLDCSDYEDGDDEDKDRSCNMEENHNEVLDDFIEHVVDKKVSSNFIDNVQQEKNNRDCNESDVTGSKPPGFEKFIKKGESPSLNSVMNDYMEDPKEVEDKEVGSNINIPHRFENVLKVCKGVSHSPSRSRTSKRSTSFGNFKTKD
nr:hypothetical protein [Tanacetum cinerariifolium]